MKKARKNFILFFFPVAIWIFLFRDFLAGTIVVSSENFYICSIIKYFFDNLRSGVWPLWEVFIVWGTPLQIFLNYVGIFNPIWLLVLFLNLIGLSMYHAFVLTTTLCFLAGVFGFYFLARVVLKSNLAAWAAFMLLLYSSASFSVYFQFHAPLVFVPSVWFFFFLFRFVQCWQKRYFVGLSLSAMIIFSTFVPFYFITVFGVFFILAVLFYFKDIGASLRGFLKFSRQHLLLVLICFAAFIFSLLPGILAYQSTVSREVVFPSRGEAEDIYEKGVRMNEYDPVARGALSERMSLEDLFSHLDIIPCGDDGFIYFPIFLYVILGLGAFLKINRKILLLLFQALVLLLIMLTNATPVHRFLFDHVFYFKLMRSPQFFQPFLLATVILLVCEQLRLFLEVKDFTQQVRRRWMAWAIVVHAGLGIFLFTLESVILSSYIALLASLLFWLLLFWGHERHERSLLFLLLLGILIQPAEVFWHHNKQAMGREPFIQGFVRCPVVKPIFSFTRSSILPGPESILQNNNYVAWFRLSMTDSPGFFMQRQTGFTTYWSYFVFQKIPRDAFRKYSHYKFYLYDRIALIEDEAKHLGEVAKIFREDSNLALVSLSSKQREQGETLDSFLGFKEQGDFKATIIKEENADFRVTLFTANSLGIETNFAQEKFLVYTDSFHPDWQAFRDGQRIPLYRAHLAFKGIRLPAGKHTILFQFNPPGGVILPFSLWAVFISMSAYLLFLLYCEPRQNRLNKNV